MTKIVALVDRGLVRVTGPDAVDFLQNLVTNDVTGASERQAVFAALLTPQGKINYEFFIIRHGDGFLLETGRGCVDELVKRLTLYKMRADVTVEDLSDGHMMFWLDEAPANDEDAVAVYPDPRVEGLGYRAVVAIYQTDSFCARFESSDVDHYHAARVEFGVPEGGYDYAYGDTFPHEAGYDLLDGVDFKKGCYVGQEVVSRMQHRGTARKRIVIVRPSDAAAGLPDPGAEIRTATSFIGPLGSTFNGRGLALVRLDRAAKALANGDEMKAEAVPVTLEVPPWASYDLSVKEG